MVFFIGGGGDKKSEKIAITIIIFTWLVSIGIFLALCFNYWFFPLSIALSFALSKLVSHFIK